MPSIETLAGFLAVSLAITFAPGPDNLMVLGTSLARGRRAGFGFALGCALGCFTHTLWASLGASAFLLASPWAFGALKLAGALYLAWLGVQMLCSRGGSLAVPAGAGGIAADPFRHSLRRGFVANAINPKVALFFLAFLPQFVPPGSEHPGGQLAWLGTLFAFQTVLAFGAIAFAAGSLGRLLQRHPALAPWLDRATGLLFLGLALRLAFDRSR